MKKLVTLSAMVALAVAMTASNAVADQVSVYTVKFVCGDGGFSAGAGAGAVTNAFYRTAINIVNPSNRGVTISKEVVLTELKSVAPLTDVTGQSVQAPLAAIETDSLPRRNAVEWDCDQLGATLKYPAHNFASGGFAKGFLIIVSDADGTSLNAPVNVVAVYTSQGKLGDRPTTIDVDEVKGRELNDLANQIAEDHHEDGE